MSSWPTSRGGEAVADGLIQGERTSTHALTDAADHGHLVARPAHRSGHSTLPMGGIGVGLAAPFEDRMGGDQSTLIEDADDVGELVHLHDPTRAIGNAVIVTADRDQ